MHKFDKIITFSYTGRTHLLCRILNYGIEKDQLKFVFVQGSQDRGIIFTKEELNIKVDDIITDYNEITYHCDGSILYKFPNYPIKSRTTYFNPKEQNFRRRPLDQINDWEPLINYEIYNYRTTEINNEYIESHEYKIVQLENEVVFEKPPIGCLINLVNKNYAIPNYNNPIELNTRIAGITAQLDIWLVISQIKKCGNYISLEGMKNSIFSDNNLIQIVEKHC